MIETHVWDAAEHLGFEEEMIVCPSMRRPIALFRAVMQRQERVGYRAAASTIGAMHRIIQIAQWPLYLRFESVKVAPSLPQNKAVGEKELGSLDAKARELGARPWCISRSGFTPAARTYAKDHNILISTRADLEALEHALKMDQ